MDETPQKPGPAEVLKETRARTAAKLADVVTEIRRLKAERKQLEIDIDAIDKVSTVL